MFGWLRKLFKRSGAAPDVGIQTAPVEVNPPLDVRALRNKYRIHRIAEQLTHETDPARRVALVAELQRREKNGR